MSVEQSATRGLDTNQPGTVEKIGYSMAGGANNVIWTGVSTFLVYFYTDVIGVGAGIIATIFLFSRIFDGISDVVMGMLLDKTRTRWGKARPWLLWLAIPFALAAVSLFSVPDVDTAQKVIYIVITYNLTLLIYTAVEIPHGTLGALMTYDSHQRSVLNVGKMIGAYVAIIIISNVTLPIVESFGGGQSSWIKTFIIYGIVAASIYFFTFSVTRERTDPRGVKQEGEKPSVKESLIALVTNKYWWLATLLLLLNYVYSAVTSGTAIYFAEYILGDPKLVGFVVTAMTLATLASMPLVIPFTRRYGKRNTALMGCILAVFGSLFLLIDPHNITIVVIAQVIRGAGKAAVFGVIFAMLADTMEYGEWKTGLRIEGLIYAGGSMGIKIGTGLGTALLGWTLAGAGYDGNMDVQPDSAIDAISGLFVYAPIIISVLMIVVLLFYNLDKLYPTILKELAAMKEESRAKESEKGNQVDTTPADAAPTAPGSPIAPDALPEDPASELPRREE